MTARRIILATVTAALCVGGTAPALASTEDTKRVCVALSGDSEKQPTAPLCVWVPLGK